MATVKIVKVKILKLCDTCLTDHTEETDCESALEEIGWFAEYDCD